MSESSKRDKDEQLAPGTVAPQAGILRSPGSGPVKGWWGFHTRFQVFPSLSFSLITALHQSLASYSRAKLSLAASTHKQEEKIPESPFVAASRKLINDPEKKTRLLNINSKGWVSE